MQCRLGCGACCTAPSISSSIPGMPNGKPAGEPCIQLLNDLTCALFGDPSRPKVCKDFTPEQYVCGNSKEEAIKILTNLENDTRLLNTQTVTRTHS